MSKNNRFKGTGVALVTPFHKDGSIDFKSLGKLVEHLIKGKVEYLVVLGTTGESVTLNRDEKAAVISYVAEVNDKRLPVVVGIGGNNTQEILNNLRSYDLSGADAVLSVSPYYNKPNQRGLYQHFKMIADVSPLPVILYNVPGRTSSNMTADTTLKLATDFKNIIAVKEASGNIEQIMKIVKNRPKDFLVISGDDMLALPVVACGGDGVISVVGNAFPKDFSEMTRQALLGNMKEAQRLHYGLAEIIEQLFADGNPGGIKAVLEMLKICQANLRLPLYRINKKTHKRLSGLVAAY